MNTKQPFSEMVTLADIEMDDIISELRARCREKKRVASLVNVTRYNWESDGSYWTVCITFKDGPSQVVSAKLLHEALNAIMEKVVSPIDLAAILGLEQ